MVDSWPLANSKLLAPDPNLLTTPTSRRVLIHVFVIDQSFDQSSGHLIAIQLLLDELLALSQLDCFLMSRMTSVARLVDNSLLFARVNCLAHWLLKLRVVQDKIYLRIDCALASNLLPGFSYN